ncbi:MAG: CorA family divalent cation transporter [Rudaea sp.]|uniref:CorA family divalent cation transporter n=1 Tax=Rudaea sp. TaxID=2136325 RepID=UPI0039E28593
MLTIHFAGPAACTVWKPGVAEPADTPVWLDLLDPDDAERAHAESVLGAKLPQRDQISAIELSSRLRSDDEILRLNIPAFVRAEAGHGAMTPLGFVLTPKLLVSVRYAESLAFAHASELTDKAETAGNSVDMFIGLIESIVNVSADRMEETAAELSKLSRAVFSDEGGQRGLLRGALFKVGAAQRQIVQLRSAMLGVSRVIAYLCEISPEWIGKKKLERFKTIQTDIGSLNEFEQQLSDRLQFLLDAVLGFINNNQNEIMKVLTIVSVVTIGPMTLAGIWGMNFKSIGEYDWPHGYAMALAAMAVSVIVPMIIFKWKRWF